MPLKVNRLKFWELYHKSFDALGPVTQPTVDNLNAILDKFETETRLKYIPEYSYCLATAFHEASHEGDHFIPIKEGRERSNSPRRKNQDRYWGKGFYGRGLVQLTHEENYLKAGKLLGVSDLYVKNPDLVLQLDHAYEIMIIGMTKGIFRGHKLSDYFRDDDATLQQYVDARDIINGDKKKNGLLIAGYAEKFENILRRSQQPETGAGFPPIEPPPVIPVQATQPVVAVPPVSAAPMDTPASDAAASPPGELEKIGNKAMGLWTAFGTMVTGAVTWLASNSLYLVICLMASATLLGITYMIINWRRSDAKDVRDRKERQEAADRELQLQIVREQHAQEAQMFSMKTAANPDIPTVTVGTPPPMTELPNSDTAPQE